MDLFNHMCFVSLLFAIFELHDSILLELGIFLGDELLQVFFTGFQRIEVLSIKGIL